VPRGAVKGGKVDLPAATMETSAARRAGTSGLAAVESPMTDLQRGYQEGFFERMGYLVGSR
jgi:hypothetical protein